MTVQRMIITITVILLLGHCVHADAKLYLDMAAACSHDTPVTSRENLQVFARDDKQSMTTTVCVDSRFMYRGVHIEKFSLLYKQQLNMYVLSMRFDKSQFPGVNIFLRTILNKRLYFISHDVVMNRGVYSVFSSVLARPEIDMTFNYRNDAMDFVYSLVGMERKSKR